MRLASCGLASAITSSQSIHSVRGAAINIGEVAHGAQKQAPCPWHASLPPSQHPETHTYPFAPSTSMVVQPAVCQGMGGVTVLARLDGTLPSGSAPPATHLSLSFGIHSSNSLLSSQPRKVTCIQGSRVIHDNTVLADVDGC